jgi:putative transposase
VKVAQAYRYAIDPSAVQLRALKSHSGAARFAWNWGLVKCKERYSVTLPRIGTVKTFESTHKLTRLLESGAARIKSATVSRVAQRWFVSFSIELDLDIPAAHPRPGSAVGVDLGVKVQITAVDQSGNVITIAGLKPLAAGLRRLRRASRSHSRKRLGSVRRRKSSARIARLHARIANQRRDATHKATSMLAKRYETVVIEDLNVAGMVKNHKLARGINDQGFGAIRRALEYKTVKNGGVLLLANRWYPSSKVCSSCGTAKTTLTLSERIYRCDHCDLVIDRDVNAARNLVYLAASGAESLNARGGVVRPGTAWQALMNLEPGASIEDKTGTASQRWAAAS